MHPGSREVINFLLVKVVIRDRAVAAAAYKDGRVFMRTVGNCDSYLQH